MAEAFEAMKYKDEVIFTSRLSTEEVNRIASASIACMFVSLFEGFGVPPLEAFRIYDYFKEGHDSKEAANFLKNEYGTGGSSHALAGADHSYEDHDAKGIKLKKGNIGFVK